MIDQTNPDQRGVSTATAMRCLRRGYSQELILTDEGPPDKQRRRWRRTSETENSTPKGGNRGANEMKTETRNQNSQTPIETQKWRSKMSEDRKRLTSGFSQTMTSVLALAVALGAVTPAYAAITNTGEVTASTPRGTDVSDTSDESVTVETPTPEFKIVKSISSISVASGDDSTNPDGGDVIVFNYAVTNTGNVTIDASTLSITDPGPTFDGNTLAGTWTGALTYVSGDTVTADSEINPNETWVYSASYTLTQTDVDRAAGITDGVTNTVTGATADSLGGDTATFDSGGSTLTAEDTIPENGAVSLTKIATRDGTNVDDGSTTPYAEGEDIVYLFTVENTGNVTLSSLTVSETAFVAPSGASAPTIDCGGGLNTIASLAPGATASCTATYTVQATDL